MITNLSKNYLAIWQTVQAIPYGKVATYGQIADLAGLPRRARLVGTALKHVPTDGVKGNIVPWYRVINSQGKISFAPTTEGFINQIKNLQGEQIVVLNGRIKLAEFQWQPDLAELLFHLSY